MTLPTIPTESTRKGRKPMATRKAPQVPGDVQDDEPPTDMTADEAPPAEPTSLPRAADIDPKTLSRAVLTASSL